MPTSKHISTAARQADKRRNVHSHFRQRSTVASFPLPFFPMPYSKINGLLVILLILINSPQVPAPVPRCSPFIFINKIAEWSNLKSDSNPYFPVPPCEYGNPIRAIKAKDYESVFVLYHPLRIPLHNIYEALWLVKTGFPRFLRVLTGKQKFVGDKRILFEGWQHYTKYPRTKKTGFKTHRDTSPIDDARKWKRLMKHKLSILKTRGPDKFDPHVDLRDTGSYTKPSYQHGHYTLHQSQKRNEIQNSNTFAQSPFENQPSLPLTAQKFSQPTLQMLQHRNHNYDNAFKTPFISSFKDKQSANSLYDSFRPINDISGGATASPVKRNTVRGFRFPDDTPSSNSEYPAPSPFNYGDKISHRRKGLFRKDANDEESRQFRKGTTVLQHISNRPIDTRFPRPGDNLQFGYNNPNDEGQFDLFNNHKHPSFGQIAGGRHPSVDEIKKINQPNKLLTSDLGQNPNNYGSGGHTIDGSRRRNLKFPFQSNYGGSTPIKDKNNLVDSGRSRNHKHRHSFKDKSSDQTIFQYVLSKIG